MSRESNRQAAGDKPLPYPSVATLRATPSGQAGRALGDTTTLADPTVVEALKARYAEDSE